MDVNAVADGGKAKIVGLAEGQARLGSSAGHPHGHRVDVVVTAHCLTNLAHRRTAEFTAPDDERVFEQAPRLQVLDQGGTRLINVPAGLIQVAC